MKMPSSRRTRLRRCALVTLALSAAPWGLAGAGVPRPGPLPPVDVRPALARSGGSARADAEMRALYHRLIPSFSRQTKLACSACHYQFPQLTPFGRLFKLNGYTLTGLTPIKGQADTAESETLRLAPIPPASAMLVVSLTSTAKSQPETQNNTASFPQELSLFLGGQVTPNVGIFTQFTYADVDGAIGIDNVDLRYASRHTFGSTDLVFGLTLHNNPTVQDLWNTTPAWGWPFMGSEVAPGPQASTLIDGGLEQHVVGLGAYSLWANTLYAEFTAYRSAPQGASLPLDASATDATHGVAPYWRVALQHEMGDTYMMVGSYGMVAQLYPTGITGPTNRFRDIAVDAQVEHKHGDAALIGRATMIDEHQTLSGSLAQDPATAEVEKNTLRSYRINASLIPSLHYSASAGWFSTTGGADAVVYAPGPVSGSAASRPNSSGFTGELDYNAWQNTRVGVQYVAYSKFNGASTNYDGSGRNASDNNTLYLFTWIAF